MRIKQVRELITDAVLAERERCARIAENLRVLTRENFRGVEFRDACDIIADTIRSANPPSIRVIRPETAVKLSELPPGTIVAGQGLDDQGNIIGNGKRY